MGVGSRSPDFCCFPLISAAVAGSRTRRQLITLPSPSLPVCSRQKKASKFPKSPLSPSQTCPGRCKGGVLRWDVPTTCQLKAFSQPGTGMLQQEKNSRGLKGGGEQRLVWSPPTPGTPGSLFGLPAPRSGR